MTRVKSNNTMGQSAGSYRDLAGKWILKVILVLSIVYILSTTAHKMPVLIAELAEGKLWVSKWLSVITHWHRRCVVIYSSLLNKKACKKRIQLPQEEVSCFMQRQMNSYIMTLFTSARNRLWSTGHSQLIIAACKQSSWLPLQCSLCRSKKI